MFSGLPLGTKGGGADFVGKCFWTQTHCRQKAEQRGVGGYIEGSDRWFDKTGWKFSEVESWDGFI